MAMAFDLRGAINVPDFQKAFNRLIASFDVMRTLIKEEDSIPQQYILEHLDYDLEYLDVSCDEQAQQNLRILLHKRARMSLDLGQCSFDSLLIKVAEQHFCLLYTSDAADE